MKLTRVGRRAGVLLPLSVGALLLAAACVPQPEPPDPVTPWLEPGCLDSDLPGVPDTTFSGIANEAGNAVAYLDESDEFVEDGSCEGTPTEPGTIVRANTEADAAAVCASLGTAVAAPPRLVDFGYPAPIDAWACEGEPDDGIVEFSSPATVAVTMFGGTPDEPTETTVDFTGNTDGTWNQQSGDMSLALDIDDGTFPTTVTDPPIGEVQIAYSAVQSGPATGSFDPTTGEGTLSLDVTMTLTELVGLLPLPSPCAVEASFDFAGGIDMTTGVLTVAQDDFTMTPPAANDCGGLGATIGDRLTEGGNAAEMTFQVVEP